MKDVRDGDRTQLRWQALRVLEGLDLSDHTGTLELRHLERVSAEKADRFDTNKVDYRSEIYCRAGDIFRRQFDSSS